MIYPKAELFLSKLKISKIISKPIFVLGRIFYHFCGSVATRMVSFIILLEEDLL